MSKKVNKFLVGILATACVGAVAAPMLSNVSASAGAKQSIFLEESFEDSLSSKKWAVSNKETTKLSSVEDSGHIQFGYNCEEYLFTTEEKLQGFEYLQFDVYMQEEVKAYWKALYFSATRDIGYADRGTFNDDFIYKPYLVLTTNGSETGVACWNGNLASGLQSGVGKNGHVDFDYNEWYTIRIERLTATTADVFFVKKGEDVKANGAMGTMTINDSSVSFDSLYIMIGQSGDSKQFAMDNFQLKSANYEINETFNKKELIDAQGAIAPLTLRDGMNYSVVKPNSYLAFTGAKAGDSVFCNADIPKEESVVESLNCIEATFDVTVGGKTDNTIAFAFGAKDASDLNKGYYQVNIGSDGVSVSSFKDGVTTELLEKVAVRKLQNASGAKLGVTVNKDGTVTLLAQDEVIAEVVVDEADYYVGAFGFIALKDNSGEVTVDNVTVKTVSYKVPVTKSVSHNFSNDYYGNEGYEDFVMNVNGGNMYTKDGRLVFEGLSDYSYFGSAHEYDSFVMDYKICNILVSDEADTMDATKPGVWMGIDLGKARNSETHYGTNVMFYLIVAPREGETTIKLNSFKEADSSADLIKLAQNTTKYKDIPAELFTAIHYDNVATRKDDVAEKDAVCVRWVAENGTLKLYLKRACELEYTLYYSVSGVDTTGYTAICNTGFLFCEIDDFSMSNISNLYINADTYTPETIIKEGPKEIIYDRGNTDMNGLNESEINKGSSGCGSQIGAAYVIVPLAVAAVALTKKRDEE